MTTWKVLTAVAAVGLAGATTLAYVAFGAFLPWREQAEIDRLADRSGVRPGDIVAEIGAGGGRFAAGLAGRVGAAGHVFATELAGPAHDALAARLSNLPNVTVVRADRADTGLPAGCCDLVLMRNVYHHVGEPEAFTRQVGRVLKPGGRLAVIDFAPGALWLHGGRPGDAAARRPGHGVSPDDVVAEFSAAGFELEISDPRWSPPMWLLLFRRR